MRVAGAGRAVRRVEGHTRQQDRLGAASGLCACATGGAVDRARFRTAVPAAVEGDMVCGIEGVDAQRLAGW